VNAESALTWAWRISGGFDAAGRPQPIFGFSWKGDPLGEGWTAPFLAWSEANADHTAGTFARFLGDLRRANGHGQDLFVMTHSLGARLAFGALKRMAAASRGPLVYDTAPTEIDGLFTFNAAVGVSAFGESGEFRDALDATARWVNLHSAADPALAVFRLNQEFVHWEPGLAVGLGAMSGRVATRQRSKVLDQDLLDRRISGVPATTHSGHLNAATRGGDSTTLFGTLADHIRDAGRASGGRR
jgi:hypothetical protein